MQRRVLITGGTGVIGSEIVRHLAADERESFDITATYVRSEAKARQLQEGTGCQISQLDAGDESQVSGLFQSLGALDAVIHAAAITHDALLVQQRREDWDESLRINATGSFLVARAALNALNERGRLVFLASRSGENGRKGQTAYAASKAATLALMKAVAVEGAPRRICCNAVCPGFVPSVLNAALSPPQMQAAREESVFCEFGAAQEVASLISWLLSSSAGVVTGQVFHCDARIQTVGETFPPVG